MKMLRRILCWLGFHGEMESAGVGRLQVCTSCRIVFKN